MSQGSTVELDRDEVDEFLGDGGTGVLSFAAGVDQSPYTLPVSYGYDANDRTFYLRLGFVDGSQKRDYVEDSRPVSLAVHDETADSGWHSVVATGELEEVTDADVGSEAMQGLGRVEIPLLDIFERPDEEVAFRFFRLDPDTLSGRGEHPR
ncbi:pyridoxamine 5'-phosphate oxidase family protein [Halobacteriales archaeon Cl-PHB]